MNYQRKNINICKLILKTCLLKEINIALSPNLASN